MAERTDYVEVGGGPRRDSTGSFLGNLATFAIAAAAVGSAMRFGSKTAASFLTKRFSGLSGGTIEQIGANYLKKTLPRIGESALAREAQAGKVAYQKWSSAWDRLDRVYSAKTYTGGARRVVKDVTRTTGYEYTKMAARTADFFRRPGLQSRAIGLGLKVARRSVEGNAAAYIADQAINVYNRREQPDNPAWWNLPGHALGFAKFSARSLPFDVLLFGGGLKYGAKMGAEAGIGGLKVAKETLISQKTTEAALHKVGKGIDWITHNLAGMEAARRQAVIRANQAIPTGMGAFKFIRSLSPRAQAKTVAAYFKGGKEGWNKFQKLSKEVPRQQFGQEIMGVITTAAQVSDKRAREAFLRHHYTTTQSGKLSPIEYILGLKRKVNFSNELKAAEESAVASLRIPKGADSAQFTETFRKGWRDTASYLGRSGVQVESGMYAGVGGRTIDLRMLTPSKIRNSAARLLNDFSFNVPILGRVHPFQYLLLPRLLEKRTFDQFEGSVYLGRDLKVKSAGKITNGAGELSVRQRPVEEGLVRGGVYTAGQGEGIFSAGSFYHLSDGTIRRLTNPRLEYKLFAKRGWDLVADVSAWLGGHYPLKKEVDAMMNAPGRSFMRRVMDKMDLGVSQADNIFDRMKGWVKQFTWNKGGGNVHPKHIYSNIRAVEAGIEGTAAGSPVYTRDLLESVDSMFMANVREGSWLRNKDFQDAVHPAEMILERKMATNDYKILVDQAQDVLSGRLGRVHPLVQKLSHEWNVERIVDESRRITDYNEMGRLMTSKVAPSGRDAYNTLTDIITLQSMVRHNKTGGEILGSLSDLSRTLASNGTLTEVEAASLRVASGAMATQYGGLLKGMMREEGSGRLKDLVSLLKGSSMRRDIETTSQILTANPLKGFDFQDQSPYATTFASYDMVKHEFRNTPHTAVPWKASGRMSTKELEMLGLAEKDAGVWPTNETGQSLTKWKFMYGVVTRRFARLFDEPGTGFYLGSYTGEGMWKNLGGAPTQLMIQGVVGRRAGLIAGAALAYTSLDNLVDAMPGLQNTPLGQGITPFLGDQLARFRMGVGMLSDATGVTSAAKYLEGLFPGMIDSPLLRVARGVVLPVWAANKIGFSQGRAGKSMAGGLIGGLALGAVQGFGTFDMTKNTAELKDIYSGREEVPYRKGRWWEASSSNYEGGKIKAWLPNWYSRLKAQHMATPEGWGGPIEQMLYKPWPLLDFNPIGFMLGGRYHYAYNHYYSRPYPETNTAFAEMPFIGPAAASTLGRIVAPPKVMHKDELYASLDRYGYSTTGGNTQRAGFIPGTSELARAFPVSPHGIRQEASRQLFNAQQAAGLPGFAMQTAMSELMGMEQPFDGDNVLESASEITSMRRQYYDMELGGLGGQTELWRRFLPKRAAGQNRINPLQNRMPRWLPLKYRLGDAYAQTPYGELVLPGKGYSSAHDVELSYPVSAEILGMPLEDTVRKMLSLGRPTPIGREEITRANARVQAAAEVYEPYNDISGTYDGIVRKGRRKILQKIKNLDSQDLSDLVGPTETDISEVNFYMRMAGVAEGVIQYRIDGVPVLAYPVRYDEQRFQKDVEIVDRARQKAAQLYAKGVGFEGEAYSHIDRANVLANVAPYSNEFKREYAMARKDITLGRGDPDRLAKIKKQRDAMMRSQDLFPRRFLGKVMTPDAEYNSMSINENIKAGAEYSLPERFLGAIWEGFNSLNHPFDKFHSYKTPLEAYKANTLYGRRIKMWDSPGNHWADAYARGFMSKDDPMTGYLAGFLGGYAFGPAGPAGGVLGGVVGAAYGTVHGAYRKIRGNAYIPGSVQEIRNISRYFDSMTYYKSMMMYDMTGNEEYLEEARSTMAGITPSDLSRQSWKRFYRATPYSEKPYTIAFLKETDPHERDEITKLVPDEMATVLRAKWAKMDGLRVDANISKVSMDKMPAPDWAGWSPEVDLSDVEMKTVEKSGFDAHDFGLGWRSQQRRIRNSPNLPGPINMSNPAGIGRDVAKGANQGEVRKLIEDTLGSFGIRGFVTVAPSYHDNTVTIVGG